MTVMEMLREARGILLNQGWCQGAYARNSDGRQVSILSPLAVTFCTVGAALKMGDMTCWIQAVKCLTTVLNQPNITLWNDAPERTLDDVLNAYDLAIAKAEQEGL